jgi:hypothetical protein
VQASSSIALLVAIIAGLEISGSTTESTKRLRGLTMMCKNLLKGR